MYSVLIKLKTVQLYNIFYFWKTSTIGHDAVQILYVPKYFTAMSNYFIIYTFFNSLWKYPNQEL